MDNKTFSQKLRSNVLNRTLPFTTLHWRFFLPKQCLGVRVHAFVFFRVFNELPLLLRVLAIIYNLFRWWLYYAWKELFVCYKQSNQLCSEKHQHSKARQLIDLTRLALAYSIPARDYYRFRLHQYPASEWLNFAFEFQVKHWHSALNYPNKPDYVALINDKLRLETLLKENGLSTVSSLHIVETGEELTTIQLNQLPNQLFFKPVHGNQSTGCFSITKRQNITKNSPLSLTWFKNHATFTEENIGDINAIIGNRKYLIQPVYTNHTDFESLFSVTKLSTIRVVTVNLHGQCSLMSAVLETPTIRKQARYWNVVIDIDNGELIKPVNTASNDNTFNNWYKNLEGKACPHWQELKSLCIAAHQHLPDILTIGWDIALSQQGPIIVEGNTSWSLAQYQALTRQPMLKTCAGEKYKAFICSN